MSITGQQKVKKLRRMDKIDLEGFLQGCVSSSLGNFSA